MCSVIPDFVLLCAKRTDFSSVLVFSFLHTLSITLLCSSSLSVVPLFLLASFSFFVFSNIHIPPKCSGATTGEIPKQSASPLKNGCILPCRLNYCIPLRMQRPSGRGEKRQLWIWHSVWGLCPGGCSSLVGCCLPSGLLTPRMCFHHLTALYLLRVGFL